MVIEGNVPRVVSSWGRLAIFILAVTLLPLSPVAAAARRVRGGQGGLEKAPSFRSTRYA